MQQNLPRSFSSCKDYGVPQGSGTLSGGAVSQSVKNSKSQNEMAPYGNEPRRMQRRVAGRTESGGIIEITPVKSKD